MGSKINNMAKNQLMKLVRDSLNPDSKTSSKRVSLLISQFLFALQVFMLIIVYPLVLLVFEPKIDVQFFEILTYGQMATVFLNAIIILWHLGAIKNVDVAFSKVLEAKFTRPNVTVQTEEAPQIIQTDVIDTDNIEHVETSEVITNDNTGHIRPNKNA